jgi:uncharacterized peroxidase-related enzyme
MKKNLFIITLVAIVTLSNLVAVNNGQQNDAISRFPIPKVEELPEDVQGMFTAVENRRGFVTNVVKALSYRPEFLKAFGELNGSIGRKDTGLTSIEREMMIVVFSVYNGCDYCIASHGFGLANETQDPELVKQLKKNYKKADITPRQKAVIEFGLKISKDPHGMDEKDFEILRSHGLSDDDIFDAGAYAAFFNMSNRMMSLMQVKPDPQFEIK